MKLKESTIRDFAEALGETDELGEYRIEHYQKAILKVSVKNNLRHIFSPLFDVKDCVLKLLSCVCFLVCFPITLILSALEYDSRRRIKVLYLYLIKHRKEIKAYKQYLKSKETKCAE
ncbi:hypothetical protein [uncultured Helicobacter sp.]|uniref:hypothetical protein n=1 Tax=uncultured Helicobacter sp. TaxID=175537 RepID=UPI00260A2351|nr:hypothetical protein [uncultured Helicobacter sp.]